MGSYRFRLETTVRIRPDGTSLVSVPRGHEIALRPEQLAHAMLAVGDLDRPTDDGVVEQLIEAGVLEERGAVSSDDRPILVLGCPKSGTTLVRYILDTHENIACGGESHLFNVPFLYDDAHAAAVDWDKEALRREMRHVVSNLLSGRARRTGKRRWAEKTPGHALIGDLIDSLLGGHALYVVIVRHALDVAASFVDHTETNWGRLGAGKHMPGEAVGLERPSSPIATACTTWRHYMDALEGFVTRTSKRCVVVHYEALVSEPELTCARMFEFLGEPFDGQMLSRVFFGDHGGGAGDIKIRQTRAIHDDRVGVGFDKFDRAAIASVERIVNDRLEAWGYPRLSNGEGDVPRSPQPPRFLRGL